MSPNHPAHPREQATGSVRNGAPVSDTTERQALWSETEGQVANTSVFLIAVLTCWLVFPVVYAVYRYLSTANHRYTLTDQRLLVQTGIFVKDVEAVELYRVKDISVQGTLLQSVFGRGRVVVHGSDATSPALLINAVPDPIAVSNLIRESVERCRLVRGVRALDF